MNKDKLIEITEDILTDRNIDYDDLSFDDRKNIDNKILNAYVDYEADCINESKYI